MKVSSCQDNTVVAHHYGWCYHYSLLISDYQSLCFINVTKPFQHRHPSFFCTLWCDASRRAWSMQHLSLGLQSLHLIALGLGHFWFRVEGCRCRCCCYYGCCCCCCCCCCPTCAASGSSNLAAFPPTPERHQGCHSPTGPFRSFVPFLLPPRHED